MAELLGDMTRRYRTAAGLSMSKLARAVYVNPAHIMRIERGTGNPSRAVTIAIAVALDLTPRQTDRYLFAAGHAPVVDWQTRAEDYAERLATVYDALDGLSLPDVDEPHPFVRRVV